jgi:branched-chain amino acid transport system substrate-binding protein
MKEIARAGLWLALVAVLAAAVAACGSSSSPTSSSSGTVSNASGGGTAADPAKGAPIKVGFICSCSGPLAATYGKTVDGIQVWAKSVNGNGGLNGHPVQVVVEDDGGNPTTALQAAKQLVEGDKVMAIVGETSLVDAAFSNYIEQQKVPVVGGQSSNAPFASNPYFFATGAGLNTITYGMIEQIQKAGAKKVGEVYCAEAPVCAQFDGVSRASAKVLNVPYSSTKVAAATPNFTAQCLALKNAGADGFVPALDAETATRAMDACVQLGYKPKLVNAGGTIGQAMLKDLNFEGDIVIQANATYTDPSYPGVKEMLDAFKKYDPSVLSSPQFNSEVFQSAWLGGKLFEAASQAAGGFSPTSTPADVLKGLYAIKGTTLGDTAPPLTFTPGKVTLPPCYYVQVVQAGALATKIHPPVCPPTGQLDALNTALGG